MLVQVLSWVLTGAIDNSVGLMDEVEVTSTVLGEIEGGDSVDVAVVSLPILSRTTTGDS